MIKFKSEQEVLSHIQEAHPEFYESHVYISGIKQELERAKISYRDEEKFRYNGDTYKIIQYIGKWHNLLTIYDELKNFEIKPSMVNRDNVYEFMLVENVSTGKEMVTYKYIALDTIIYNNI